MARGRLLCAGVLALAGVVLAAAPASAHAGLVSTDPAEGSMLDTAPDEATFTFDESVRLPPSGVHVLDAGGKELEASARTADKVLSVDLPELRDGTYVVAWRVISADGHPVAGALTFSLGTPSERVVPPVTSAGADPSTDLSIVRGLEYAGVLLVVGLFLFRRFVEQGPELWPSRIGAGVAAGAAVLLIPLSALHQSGEGLAGLATPAPWFGNLSRPEVVSAALVVAGVVVRGWFSMLALAGLVAVGHSRVFEPQWLGAGSDALHVLAGSFWLGGLVGLLLERPSAGVLARFSTFAAGLLGTAAVTGLVLTWRVLGTWDLTATAYGRLLLVKLGVVLVVVAIAAYNRYRLLPRAGDVRRTVMAEVGLLAVVLAVTGFLVERSPAEQDPVAAQRGFDAATFTGLTGQVRVYAVVEPGRVGSNEVLLQVQDLAGEPLEPFAAPTLVPVHGDLSLGEQGLQNIGSGTYAAKIVVPRPGTWELKVSVRLSEFDNPVIAVPVTMK